VINIFNVAQQKKSLGEAIEDIADTTKAAAVGYGSAFAGSAIKAGLQQSESQALRSIAGTSALLWRSIYAYHSGYPSSVTSMMKLMKLNC
jgi:hypothetical protein